ncbi:MAG: HAD family hydrolase [Eubacterium sp.]
MKPEMIVTDLDGTLLRTDKSISDLTKNTINELKKSGVIFVLATARPIRSVKRFLPFLDYDAAVHHNGAVVRVGNNIISDMGIQNPLKTVNLISKDFPNLKISVEANDMLYANFNAENIWQGVEYIKTVDFHELENTVADKIILEAHCVEEMNAFKKYITDDLYIQLSENTIAMIMNKQATKSNGVKLLARHYGISIKNTVAFGDDYNDIDMLKACGIGVAVENALDEVKSAADFVCADNDSDGVARWLLNNI